MLKSPYRNRGRFCALSLSFLGGLLLVAAHPAASVAQSIFPSSGAQVPANPSQTSVPAASVNRGAAANPPSAPPARRWTPRKGTPRSLGVAIAQILSDPAAARAHWGISVTTLEGAPIYALNESQLFQPASNAKLFTTAAALALLGPEYQAKTYLLASGRLNPDGRLQGELRLLGAADPALSNRIYPYAVANNNQRLDTPPSAFDDFASAVIRSGILAVDGTIDADDTFFPYERYAEGWSWDDLQWEYGAPVSALAVNDNSMYLNVQPGVNYGEPVQVNWAIPNSDSTLDETGLFTAMPGSKPSLGVEHQPGSAIYRVFGQVPATSEMPNPQPRAAGTPPSTPSTIHLGLASEYPSTFAADLFRQALANHGVLLHGGLRASHRDSFSTQTFNDQARQPLRFKAQAEALAALEPAIPSGDKILAVHTGPPLLQDVTLTNKISQNLHAELLLHTLGRAYGKDGSTAEGARVVRQFAVNAGVSPDDFVFFDGSGLSSEDLVAPRAFTTLLGYAMRQPWGGAYRDSLPIGGVDGTLTTRFTTPLLKGRVFAKTGTLAEARALSGFLAASSGRTLVFSILVDGRSPGSSAERAAMDRIVGAIAATE